MEKKIIRFLTLHFYPDASSTSNLLTDLAFGLADNGYNIEVLTSQPLHHHKKNVKISKYEEINSVKIFRFSGPGISKNSKIGKVFNYLFFFVKTFLKVFFTSKKNNKYLYFIVSNPPILPLIGAFFNYTRKIDFIHLLYDVHPEQSIAVGYLSANNIFVKVWKWLMKFIYKYASHTIVLSEEMRDTVIDKLKYSNADESKFREISIIDNWADGKFFTPIEYSNNKFILKNNLQGKFLVNYSGNIGVFQKFDSLFSVAEILKNEDIRFIFVGDGVKKKGLEERKREKNLNNVIFFPYQGKDILSDLQAASHLSVVHLEEEIEGFAFPSKLYTVLAAGTPVLALCRENSRLARIIKEADCGYVCQHRDIDGIKSAILELSERTDLLEKFRMNARSYFEKNYTLEISLGKYKKVFNKFL